jgi:hypothetical protein
MSSLVSIKADLGKVIALPIMYLKSDIYWRNYMNKCNISLQHFIY